MYSDLSRLGGQGDASTHLVNWSTITRTNSLLHGARVPANLEISKGPADPERGKSNPVPPQGPPDPNSACTHTSTEQPLLAFRFLEVQPPRHGAAVPAQQASRNIPQGDITDEFTEGGLADHRLHSRAGSRLLEQQPPISQDSSTPPYPGRTTNRLIWTRTRHRPLPQQKHSSCHDAFCTSGSRHRADHQGGHPSV